MKDVRANPASTNRAKSPPDAGRLAEIEKVYRELGIDEYRYSRPNYRADTQPPKPIFNFPVAGSSSR